MVDVVGAVQAVDAAQVLRVTLVGGAEEGESCRFEIRSATTAEVDPDPQGLRQRLLTAAAWVLDLDVSARTDVRAGRTVVKRVPGQDPEVLSPLSSRARPADYVASRPSVGELIRPLLLQRLEPAPLLSYQRDGVE